ncbi:MAG TPA: hypothetical protein DDW50_11045 [Firmicutes bacterium]|jgi:kynurenine formamidase|nr:hypothetical protein [Bacillota bacterium]
MRILDLSIRPYGSPIGYGRGAVDPMFNWIPEQSVLSEPVGGERTPTEIMSYHDLLFYRIGPFYDEIYQLGTLTTKPYCTYITYSGVGKHLAVLPANRLVGRAKVIDIQIEPGEEIKLNGVMNRVTSVLESDDIVIFRTGYSKERPSLPSHSYAMNSPFLSLEVVQWLIGKGIKLFATDLRNVEPFGRNGIRKTFNQAGIPVVEDLANLTQLASDEVFLMVGLPLPIFGASGGPVRVMAFQSPLDLSKPIDCTFQLSYPDAEANSPYPFEPPLPERIEPRDLISQVSAWTRVNPFDIVDSQGDILATEMYINYSHNSTTHIEGPCFDPIGEHGISDELLRRYHTMPLDRLTGPACLIDLSNIAGAQQMITTKMLKKANPQIYPGDIAVIRTNYNEWFLYGRNMLENVPGFTTEAAEWLADQGIKCFVIDAPSHERCEPRSGNPGMRYTAQDCHYAFFNRDIPIVDHGMNFSYIRSKRMQIAILPLFAKNQPNAVPAQIIGLE